MKLIRFQRLDQEHARITLHCPTCHISYEIEIKYSDIRDIDKELSTESDREYIFERRITIDAIPPNVPQAIKLMVSLDSQSCIPVYFRRMMDQPPRTGNELDLNYLLSLGIPK